MKNETNKMASQDMNIKIERAKYALENQIGWQRYATSKILLLFTLAGGTLIALINDINIKNLSDSLLNLSWYSRIFLYTSIFTLVISIIPFWMTFVWNWAQQGQTSLISWNQVRKRKYSELLDDVEKSTEVGELHDILNEHLAGSKITRWFHIFFVFGMLIYFAGLFIFLIPWFF